LDLLRGKVFIHQVLTPNLLIVHDYPLNMHTVKLY
jgi:hypothetical protein